MRPPRRAHKRVEIIVISTICMALAGSFHCGDGDTTGRSRIQFGVEARGTRVAGTTSLGWEVTLSEAAIHLGAVRWFEGQALSQRTLLRRLAWGTAFAHPGHYVPGQALAESVIERVIDLAAMRATDLGLADGVSGEARSARLELTPVGSDSGQPGGLSEGSLRLRGVATRGDQSVRFLATPTLRYEVQGITAPGTLAPGGPRWRVEIDPVALVDRVDFLMLPAGDGERVAPPEGQAFNALSRAAQSAATYHLRRLDP